MPKVTLEFDLDKEYEGEYALVAFQAVDWCLAACEMDEYLRQVTKYASDNVPGEVLAALRKARDHLRELLQDKNLSLEVLP